MNDALHAGLTAINQATAQLTDGVLIAAKCRALLRGYAARWHDNPYQPFYIERLMLADLINPATQRISRTYRLAGRVDVLATYHDRNILIDHKTTSQDIQDPAGSFWRQLVVESQPSHYMLLALQNGIKCDDAVWDVVRKPSISPKKLTKAEARSVVATQKYFDIPVSESTWADVAWLSERETPELYEARLTYDCTHERPEWYFQRRSIPRLDSELLDHAKDLWDVGQDILNSRNMDRHIRNSGACMLYGSPCKFLGICSGYDSSASDKWTRKAQIHNELPELEGDGRDVLTHSRIRSYQTCRRKHYYEYELGIERIDEEEKEALLFGTVWHQGQEAFWSSFLLQQENEHGDSDSPPSNEPGGNANAPATIDVGGREEGRQRLASETHTARTEWDW
jgi:hypothetical protein